MLGEKQEQQSYHQHDGIAPVRTATGGLVETATGRLRPPGERIGSRSRSHMPLSCSHARMMSVDCTSFMTRSG